MLTSEDEMIEYRAIHRLGGGGEAARGAAVGFARPWIATRVIVGKDDADAAVRGRVDNDCAERKFSARLVALVAREVNAA